jgi:hypothetical protein
MQNEVRMMIEGKSLNLKGKAYDGERKSGRMMERCQRVGS